MTIMVPPDIQAAVTAIGAGDTATQDAAYATLMAATTDVAPWAYGVWDDLLALLHHPNNRARAIAGQTLSGLAKSDPDGRMARDVGRLVAATYDERFVTARHILLSLEKVGVAGPAARTELVRLLGERFRGCGAEKNATLIRYDILCVLRAIHDATADASVEAAAREIIALRTDPTYEKKYASAWKRAAATKAT